MPKQELDAVFERLAAILKPYARRLVLVTDTPHSYYLDTPHELGKGKRLFFGAAGKGKNYVSFYLMPVYARPELLDGISPGLKKHMQGKSCFNFKTVDEPLFRELTQLTKAGFETFEAGRFL